MRYYRYLKRKKFTLFSILSSIVIIIWLHNNFENLNSITILQPYFFQQKVDSDYCKHNQEWSDINGDIFFRRQTAKYYTDRRELIVFFMCRHLFIQNYNFTINSELILNKRVVSSQEHTLTQLNQFLDLNGYEVYSVSTRLNLKEYNNHLKNIRIFFSINMKHNISSSLDIVSEKLEARIEDYRSMTFERNSIVICTEPLYLEDKDFKDFEFWVELNKMIGYEKIAIFNNSIPNNDLYNKLFERHKDFIDVFQFNCLPNFIKRGGKYLKHFKEFVIAEWSMSGIFFFGLDSMAINECLYHYSNKAKLILVQDNDETFIPPRLNWNFEYDFQVVNYLARNKFSQSNKGYNSIKNLLDYNKSCTGGSNHLSDYVGKIYAAEFIPNDYSIYFRQVLYAKPSIISIIFEQLDTIDKNLDSIYDGYPIRVKIEQEHTDPEPNFMDDKYRTEFTFLIESFEDYTYAMNMLFLYRELISPFLRDNEKKLSRISLFRRFYFFNGSLKPESYLGKSMVNPDRTVYSSPHYPNDNYVDARFNYLSHFRNRHVLSKDEVSIRTLNIDFNYFICYFKPVFEMLYNKNN